MDYTGKTALVTGASSGLGEGIARELARLGAHVILVARRMERLEALAAEIAAAGGAATAMACDVTDEHALEALATQVEQKFPQLHLLVNSAGRELLAPLQVMNASAARDLLELNVLSTATVTQALMGVLKAGSAVVNLASVRAERAAPALAMYCASKGAVISMTKALAVELAGRKIRVNAVAPGFVQTPLLERTLARCKPEQAEALKKSCPLGFGTVEDVAKAVAFIGSDDARWITGTTLFVDGGMTAG